MINKLLSMDDISDLKKDLTAIKSVTDDNGRIKAWIDNVEVKTEKIKFHINTALGEEIIEEFKNPSVWSEEYAFVEFVNQSGIDVRLIDDIYDFEIRYDPETEDIKTIDSEPDVSEVNISEDVYQLVQLKKRTINDEWVKCQIEDVTVNDNVQIEIELPNTGHLTFYYNVPESWEENKYAVVELCNSLGVNSSDQLIGCEVAVSPKVTNTLEFEHTSFYDPDYSIDSNRNVGNYQNKYSLIPIRYLNEGIPQEKNSSDAEDSSNNSGDGFSQVIMTSVMMLVFVILMASMMSFTTSLTESIADPEANIIINEQDESVQINVEEANNDSIVIMDNGKKVRELSRDGMTYIYDPTNKQGTVKLLVDKGSDSFDEDPRVLSKLEYDFTS